MMMVTLFFSTALMQALPAGCNAFPNGCYYEPAGTSFALSTSSFTYRDAARQERTVNLAIRLPALSGPLPVVIWSHGGGPQTNASETLRVWSETTARAGYLTISVAHAERTVASQSALCAAFDVSEETCSAIDASIWDRPNDLRQVINALERLNATAGSDLRNRVDTKRIAVAGHAHGAGAALALAGARRVVGPLPVDTAPSLADERVALVLAITAAEGGDDGFFDNDRGRPSTSWQTIDRRVMLVSGAGDSVCRGAACVNTAYGYNRRMVFDLLAGGDAERSELYLDTIQSYPELFADPDVTACEAKGVATNDCVNMKRALDSSVLAYFDAHLRKSPSAMAWREGALVRAASGGMAQFRMGGSYTLPNPDPGPAQACPGYPGCLYEIPREYPIDTLKAVPLTYRDMFGRQRTIEVTYRYPVNRTGRLPIVIWAHGGAEGRNFEGGSVGAMSDWATMGAQYGYLSVAPAFRARTGDDKIALCDYLAVSREVCEMVETTSWDRPFDMKAIIDFLEQQNLRGQFAGRLDLDALAVVGHSAGSAAALSLGGAAREYVGKRYDFFSDARPKAVVALSPQAGGASYLFDKKFKDGATSWDAITRPVLICTGAGDAHGQSPHWRRIPYERLPAGDKYRLWVNDTDYGHENYGDAILGECSGAKCEAFIALMRSTVFAFLDAYTQKLPAAVAYIQSENVARALRGTGEWARK